MCMYVQSSLYDPMSCVMSVFRVCCSLFCNATVADQMMQDGRVGRVGGTVGLVYESCFFFVLACLMKLETVVRGKTVLFTMCFAKKTHACTIDLV